MECLECKGKGYVIEPDHQHDCMIKKECVSCMMDDNYREHLSFEMSKLLAGLSNQKLAQTVASLLVNHSKYINDPHSLYFDLINYYGFIFSVMYIYVFNKYFIIKNNSSNRLLFALFIISFFVSIFRYLTSQISQIIHSYRKIVSANILHIANL